MTGAQPSRGSAPEQCWAQEESLGWASRPQSRPPGHACPLPASWAGCSAPLLGKEPLWNQNGISQLCSPSDQPWQTAREEAEARRPDGSKEAWKKSYEPNMFRPRNTDQGFQRWAESKGQPAPAWPPVLRLFLEKGPPGPLLVNDTSFTRRQAALPSVGPSLLINQEM